MGETTVAFISYLQFWNYVRQIFNYVSQVTAWFIEFHQQSQCLKLDTTWSSEFILPPLLITYLYSIHLKVILQFPCSLPSKRYQRHLPTQFLCEFIASSIPVVCTTLSQNHVFQSPNITSTAWIFLLLYPTTKYFFSILFFNTCTYTLSLNDNIICICAQSTLKFWKATEL